MARTSPRPLRVAVAGASGYVGRSLVRSLASRHEVIALGRRVDAATEPRAGQPPEPGVRKRRCDAYSLLQLEQALEGCDAAYYLVHSMARGARLTQGEFSDIDLLLADNFGRAAKAAGVQRIVYLGGLVPADGEVSAHLASRREVEDALGAHGVPVTAVRAGLVIGPGGSSFAILERLVRRLPAMVTPRWTLTPTQPIALQDVVRLLELALEDERATGRVCDIGGPEVLTYRELIVRTAKVMGREVPTVSVPVITPALSRLWVSAITGAPRELVAPLIRSLAHPMVVRDGWLQQAHHHPGLPLDDALAQAFAGVAEEAPWPEHRPLERDVRSVQRLPRPPGMSAVDVTAEYLAWLPRFTRPAIRVEVDGDVARLYLRGGLLLLELTRSPERSSTDRQVLYITGGALVRLSGSGRGRLEFRETHDGQSFLAAIHDYHPTLPWPLYLLTQAQAHIVVMDAFSAHLGRLARARAKATARPEAIAR